MPNPFKPAVATKKYLKVAVFGPPGSGKTHFALTFPKVAVIDTEQGTDLFTDRFQFQVLHTKRPAEVLAAIEAVEAGEVDCETLVIDSFTVINDVMREAVAKVAEERARAKGRNIDDNVMTMRDWGNLRNRIRTLMTRLYNLPVHVVITGWTKDVYADTTGPDEPSRKVGTTLDADKKVLYQPDILLEMERDTHGIFWATVVKDRSGKLPPHRIKNPSFAMFGDILNHQSAAPAQAERQEEEMEAIAAEAVEMENGHISRAMWQRIHAKAREVGLTEDELHVLMFARFGVSSTADLSDDQAATLIAGLSNTAPDKLKASAQKLLARITQEAVS